MGVRESKLLLKSHQDGKGQSEDPGLFESKALLHIPTLFLPRRCSSHLAPRSSSGADGAGAGSLGGLFPRTVTRHVPSARGNKHLPWVTSHPRGMRYCPPSSSPTEHLSPQASHQQAEKPVPGATAPLPSISPATWAGRKQVWGKDIGNTQTGRYKALLSLWQEHRKRSEQLTAMAFLPFRVVRK